MTGGFSNRLAYKATRILGFPDFAVGTTKTNGAACYYICIVVRSTVIGDCNAGTCRHPCGPQTNLQ